MSNSLYTNWFDQVSAETTDRLEQPGERKVQSRKRKVDEDTNDLIMKLSLAYDESQKTEMKPDLSISEEDAPTRVDTNRDIWVDELFQLADDSTVDSAIGEPSFDAWEPLPSDVRPWPLHDIIDSALEEIAEESRNLGRANVENEQEDNCSPNTMVPDYYSSGRIEPLPSVPVQPIRRSSEICHDSRFQRTGANSRSFVLPSRPFHHPLDRESSVPQRQNPYPQKQPNTTEDPNNAIAIVKNSTDPTLLTLTSFPFRVVFANKVCQTMLGRPYLVGSTFYDLFPSEGSHVPTIASCHSLLGRFDDDIVRVSIKTNGESDEGREDTMFCKIKVEPVMRSSISPTREQSLRYFVVKLAQLHVSNDTSSSVVYLPMPHGSMNRG